MGVGFSQGLAQVTLALFTTLAPAGMVAFCVMACVLLFGKLSEKQWERMSHFLVVQLAVEVCVDGRVDAQAYCSFSAADAVNLYAAVLHKSVMRVDIFYASDNFFRLHKSFLL